MNLTNFLKQNLREEVESFLDILPESARADIIRNAKKSAKYFYSINIPIDNVTDEIIENSVIPSMREFDRDCRLDINLVSRVVMPLIWNRLEREIVGRRYDLEERAEMASYGVLIYPAIFYYSQHQILKRVMNKSGYANFCYFLAEDGRENR